jgi:hypothetical protein
MAAGAISSSASKTLSTDHKYSNRLANEESPYLLQHAHNPVSKQASGSWHNVAYCVPLNTENKLFGLAASCSLQRHVAPYILTWQLERH